MHRTRTVVDCGCGEHAGGHPHHSHHGRAGGYGGGRNPGGCDHGVSGRFLKPYVMLLLAEQPAHGYELTGRLAEFGVHPGSTDPSMLYRILRSLEAEGLASSRLDPSGTGPARKVYSLTDEGMEVLGIWASKLAETASFFEKFADRYQKLGRDEAG